jgi:hypothetical protein
MAVTHGPPHHITISGIGGTVRYGYQTAAELGEWKVDGGWLVAQVKVYDAFRLMQAPLTLTIPNRTGPPTVRPLADVTIIQGQLTARLLPKVP